MALYTILNRATQGHRVEYFKGSVEFGFTLGAGDDARFEADTLHPNTLALIEGGVFSLLPNTSLGGVPATKKKPQVVWAGAWKPGAYSPGEMVAHGGVHWINDVTGNTNVPDAADSGWFASAGNGDAAAHAADFDNPHGTTATQVGSIPTSARGEAGGVAQLDYQKKLHLESVPDLSGHVTVAPIKALSHPKNGDSRLAEGTSSQVEAADIRHHLDATGNPHGLELGDLGGLSASTLGQAGGVAQLGGDGKIVSSQLPPLRITNVNFVTNNTQRDALASSLSEGDAVVVQTPYKQFLWSGSEFVEIQDGTGVTVINGKTGPVVVLTTDDLVEGVNRFVSNTSLQATTLIAGLSALSHAKNGDEMLGYGTASQVSSAQLRSHLESVSNPHAVTADQVGALPKILGFRELNSDYEVQSTDNAMVLRFVADAVVTFDVDLPVGFQVSIISVEGANVTLSDASLVSRGVLLNQEMAGAYAYKPVAGRLEAFGDFAVI